MAENDEKTGIDWQAIATAARLAIPLLQFFYLKNREGIIRAAHKTDNKFDDKAVALLDQLFGVRNDTDNGIS